MKKIQFIFYLTLNLHLFINSDADRNSSSSDQESTQNPAIAWSIAGLGILLAFIFLALFLSLKIRDMSCYGCHQCRKGSFHLNGVDLASVYRQSYNTSDSEHNYDRINDVKHTATVTDASSQLCQTNVQMECGVPHSVGTGYGEEYLAPRISTSTQNFTDDLRILQPSSVLKSFFWSQESLDDCYDTRDDPHLHQHRGITQCNENCKARSRRDDYRRRNAETRAKPSKLTYHGYPTSGHFIPGGENVYEELDDERTAITSSMVDVFTELLNVANRSFRSDLLRRLRRLNSTWNDYQSRRMSQSETDLSLFEKYGGSERQDPHPSVPPLEDHYASVQYVKKQTPTPKRRKSLSRKQNLETGSGADGNTSDTGWYDPISVRLKTVQCQYQVNRDSQPVPLPRSKSLNRDQIPSQGILKMSGDRSRPISGSIHNGMPVNYSLMPDQYQGGDYSLNHTAQKVKKATYLDGCASPKKEYLNVRMVVKNLSCSADDIGLDSEFWNS